MISDTRYKLMVHLLPKHFPEAKLMWLKLSPTVFFLCVVKTIMMILNLSCHGLPMVLKISENLLVPQ